jgi:divalent metal cation (Fe/Co/Zn/Cd) transporter
VIAPSSATAEPALRRADLRSGVRVEAVSLAWMVVEAAAAIISGVLAGSVLLTAFGLDSVIELLTGGILLWRLHSEASGAPQPRVEQMERRAAWIVGISLALLCLYILVGALIGLLLRLRPDTSTGGLLIACASLLIMPMLARRKRQIAVRIESAALRGDAACSVTCAYMAGALLLGLALHALLGWWWAESLAALAFLWWLAREAREALAGARSGHGACCCGAGACGR